jgi:hypothetical protein
MEFKVGDLVRYKTPPTNDHQRYEGEITSIADGSITIIWRDVVNSIVEIKTYTQKDAPTQLKKSVPENKKKNAALKALLAPTPGSLFSFGRKPIGQNTTPTDIELKTFSRLSTPHPPPSGSHGGGTKKRSRRRKQRKSRRSKRSVRI